MNELKKRRIEEKIRSMPEDIRDKGVELAKQERRLSNNYLKFGLMFIGISAVTAGAGFNYFHRMTILVLYIYLIVFGIVFNIYFIKELKIERKWKSMLKEKGLSFLHFEKLLKYKKRMKLKEQINNLPENVRDKGFEMAKQSDKLYRKSLYSFIFEMIAFMIIITNFFNLKLFADTIVFIIIMTIVSVYLYYTIIKNDEIIKEWREYLQKTGVEYLSLEYLSKYGVN